MCSAFPNRAEELDAYLAHIVETARVWPQKFYEYHKMFSSICSIMLQEHNIKLDWSLGDPELRQLVCAGSRVNMCNLCSSTLHSDPCAQTLILEVTSLNIPGVHLLLNS